MILEADLQSLDQTKPHAQGGSVLRQTAGSGGPRLLVDRVSPKTMHASIDGISGVKIKSPAKIAFISNYPHIKNEPVQQSLTKSEESLVNSPFMQVSISKKFGDNDRVSMGSYLKNRPTTQIETKKENSSSSQLNPKSGSKTQMVTAGSEIGASLFMPQK